MANPSAASILEYLTTKNPDLNVKDKPNASLTRKTTFIRPSHALEWTEFSFQTMENVFGGKLMEECRKERSLFYPTPRLESLDPLIYRTESDEPSTRRILTLWTYQMVNAALTPVRDIFDPVFWVDTGLIEIGDETTEDDCLPVTTRTKRGRTSARGPSQCQSPFSSATKRKRSRPPKPDAAGLAFGSGPERGGSSGNKNRLPMEIKPGSHWTSKRLLAGDLTKADGKLRSPKEAGKDVWPIIQIYHYCVQAGARYGLLITSKELLVVRIGPMIKAVPPASGETARTLLQNELQHNGLLEYKVIPWDNYFSSASTTSKHNHRDLTMNLSMWIVCILAGNDSDVDWKYDPLKDEVLKSKGLSKEKKGTAEETLLRSEEAEREENEMARRLMDDGIDDSSTGASPSVYSSFTFSNPSASMSVSQIPPPKNKKPPSYISQNEQKESISALAASETQSGGMQTRKRGRQADDVIEALAERGEGSRRRRRKVDH